MKGRRQVYTLAFLKRNNDVLLGFKTRGLGEGLWNGFGGKVESKETIFEAAEREIKEECGLEVDDLKQIGIMQYEEDACPQIGIVHIFTGTKIRGTPQASEEMNPVQWYRRKDLILLKMYDDFKDWEMYMFGDEFFCGKIRYNNKKQIVERYIKKCDSLKEAVEYMEY